MTLLKPRRSPALIVLRPPLEFPNIVGLYVQDANENAPEKQEGTKIT